VVEQLDASAEEVRLRGEGRVGEEMAVSARLVLARYNLADGDASRAEADAVVCQQMRQQFELLYRGVGAGTAG